MDPLELINSGLYQILVRRAAHHLKWAEYFLLINACYEIAKRIPKTSEECDQTNIEELIEQTLEIIGKAVEDALPGGVIEFAEYMPNAPQLEIIDSSK
ncbi:MAG TPA: hypothetical protein VFN35_25085 [Ktedonobacteraceae bacterium]|nr:hypothetical protein [Ktedonobacteraceae bacterium]